MIYEALTKAVLYLLYGFQLRGLTPRASAAASALQKTASKTERSAREAVGLHAHVRPQPCASIVLLECLYLNTFSCEIELNLRAGSSEYFDRVNHRLCRSQLLRL